MMASKWYSCLPLFCLLSCSSLPHYSPALVSSRTPGIITLASTEHQSASTAMYFSIDGGSGEGSNRGELNTIGGGHLLFVRANRYATMNAGVFAYGGTYSVKDVAKYRGKYSYWGSGLEFNQEVHFPIQRVDIGVGMYVAEALEFGDYRTFRKKSDKEGLSESKTGPEALKFSFYPLIRYRVSDRTIITLQGELYPDYGPTPVLSHISPLIVFQHDDLAVSCYWLPQYHDDMSALSVNLAYRVR